MYNVRRCPLHNCMSLYRTTQHNTINYAQLFGHYLSFTEQNQSGMHSPDILLFLLIFLLNPASALILTFKRKKQG